MATSDKKQMSIEKLTSTSMAKLGYILAFLVLAGGCLTVTQWAQSMYLALQSDLETKAKQVSEALAGEVLLGDDKGLAIRVKHLKEKHELDELSILRLKPTCDGLNRQDPISLASGATKNCVVTEIPGVTPAQYLYALRELPSPNLPIHIWYVFLATCPLLFFTVLAVFIIRRKLRSEVVEPINDLKENLLHDVEDFLEGDQKELSFSREYTASELSELTQHIKWIAETLKETQERAVQKEIIARTHASIALATKKLTHDMNRPLSQSLTYLTQICETDDPGKIKQLAKTSLQQVQVSVEDFNHMARQLTDLGTKKDLELRPESVEKIVEQAIRSIPESKIRPNIKIDYDFNHTGSMMASFPDMKRAVANIIENAFLSVNDGGKITIKSMTSDLGTDRDHIVLSIENTGSYIPKSQWLSIFRPLYTTRGSKGTGLGLASANDIAASHDGFIILWSMRDEGTEFMIKIPASGDVKPEKVILPSTTSDLTTKSGSAEESNVVPLGQHYKVNRAKVNILIVDDDQFYASELKAMIEKSYADADVFLAHSPSEAMSQVRKHGPELIFMDIELQSEENGRDLTERIKKSGLITFIWFHSHLDSKKDRELCRAVGGDGFAEKPMRPKKLTEVLNFIDRSPVVRR